MSTGNLPKHRILVVSGVGNGSGTGAATAREFAKAGYRVALIARGADSLKKVADDINASGGVAAPFPVQAYDFANISAAFKAISELWPRPDNEIRVAVWNTSNVLFKSFLECTEEIVRSNLEINAFAPFAFAREAISAFKDQAVDEHGKRGSLIFTSATSATRGTRRTAVFSAGKSAARALNQSLAKEYGVENIHISNVVVDGAIVTDAQRARFKNKSDRDSEFLDDVDKRLNPDVIAKTYMYLVKQDRSAWTWELDLRPAHEKW